MADETPNTTPPNPQSPTIKPPVAGVRPITIKPVIPSMAQQAGPAAPVQPPAGGVPSPSTIRLKPVVQRPETPASPVGGGGPDGAPTVRVRPMITAKPPLTTGSTPASASGGAPQPGGSPLPPGPKPLKPEQIQAAKSKTSRISLDAALIGGQEERGGPKTIRLKRPTDAPVGKITSHLGAAAAAATGQSPSGSQLIPPISKEPAAPVVNRFTQSIDVPNSDLIVRRNAATAALAAADGEAKVPSGSTSVLPADAAPSDEPSITRRKTIRVKRPGSGSAPTFRTPASQAAAAADGSSHADGETGETGGTVIEEMPVFLPAAKTHWFFPVVAVAALFVMIALLVVQLAQDRELLDHTAWPPNAPAVRLPGMAPIPGRG